MLLLCKLAYNRQSKNSSSEKNSNSARGPHLLIPAPIVPVHRCRVCYVACPENGRRRCRTTLYYSWNVPIINSTHAVVVGVHSIYIYIYIITTVYLRFVHSCVYIVRVGKVLGEYIPIVVQGDQFYCKPLSPTTLHFAVIHFYALKSTTIWNVGHTKAFILLLSFSLRSTPVFVINRSAVPIRVALSNF